MSRLTSPFLAAIDQDVELALQEIDAGSSSLGSSDVRALAVIVLEEVQAAAEVKVLDERISATTELDTSSLKKAVALFEKDAVSELQLPVPGRDPILFGDRVLKMRERVTALESERNPIGIGLGISFLGMAMNAAIAILHENHRPLPPGLPDLLGKKLTEIPEKDLWTAWRQIQNEFAVDEDYPYYKTDDPAVPTGFLLADDVDTVRDRIAEFLLEVKPKLFASGIMHGVRESPAVAPPLPAFLAVGDTAVHRPTRRQEHLMTELSRALSLWPNAEREDLFEALDLDPKGWLARDSRQRFEKLSEADVGHTIGPSHQLRALRRLLAYADAFAQLTNPLEALLTAFKHSREVVADASRDRNPISSSSKEGSP